MSDPVTNIEIEDVLSSIRRLVSEDGRREPPLRRADPAAQPPADPVRMAPKAALSEAARPVQPTGPQPEPDRLVLTPSQRVPVTDDSDWGARDPKFDDSAFDAPEFDAPAFDELDTVDVNAEDSDDVAAPDLQDRARVVADGEWEDPRSRQFGSVRGKSGRPAILRPSFEDRGSEGELSHPTQAALDALLQDDHPIYSEDEGELDQDLDADLIAPADTGPEQALSLTEKIEALEAVISRTREQWEPDGDHGDHLGLGSRSMAWQDDLVEDGASPSSTDPRPAEAETALDAVMDEDSLRELVAEIVRQELQGALGERITRNVRKLVRREIQRALTAQALD